MFYKIQDTLILFWRIVLKAIYIFPLKKDKVFFSSYEGKQFSCNPKYIFRVLQEKGSYSLVYEYNDNRHPPDELCGIILVRHNTIRFFYHLLTAAVIVTNSGISAKIPIRRKQVLINTWHAGGAYKKVGKDISREVNGSGRCFIDISTRQTSYFLTSSKGFSEGTAQAVGIPTKKLFECGMPRNDILISGSEALKIGIYKRVKNDLGLSDVDRFVLYAPTFRTEWHHMELIDEERVIDAFSRRFNGEWYFVYRGHYSGKNQCENHMINATDYPDMQELLIAADALITDYSSSIWDFSFTDKPGFLFAPDLKDYEQERDFYLPIREWAYPLAETNEELIENISNYDLMAQLERNRRHHEKLNSYEDGHGTEKVVNLIISKLK